MKNKLFVGSVMLAGVFIFQNVALANPFVFEFTETYDSTTNATIFGTAAKIALTLDNGNASSANQTYSWNDIIGVSVQAVGGTYSDTWTNIYRSTDASVFLTTELSGTFGALYFGSGPDEYVNGSSTFTLGQYNQLGSGSYTTLALTFTDVNNSAYIYRDIQTIATLVTLAPVPEPETYAMLLAGLGLLGLTARRRRQKLNA